MKTDILEYLTVPDYLEEGYNNILYVDDEESNLRVFDSVFSRYYNIYTANNGNTAINMLREYDIHMIITDQKMPEMTGTDLLEKILGEFPDIIRIILTGFSDIQAIIKAINKCSIYKYITKPYENSEIKEVIDNGMEIYNMRKQKYSPEEALVESEQTSGQVVLGASDPEEAQMNQALASLINTLAKDINATDEDFEAYFDFHINYYMNDSESAQLHHDFTIHSGEESTKLFLITFKTAPGQAGTVSFMYIKSKLRSLLEDLGNEVTPLELLGGLTAAFDSESEEMKPFDFKIVTYEWETGTFQYLTSEKNMKLFAVGQQLTPLNLELVEEADNNYFLYQAESEEDLVVYFWDFCLSEEGNEYDSPGYFTQIVNHATNLPFDLQGSQISSGIKSVSQHFDDAKLFALYLND